MSELKPELTREELIEVIKALRAVVWEVQDAGLHTLDEDDLAALDAANDAIDPNFAND